MNYQRRIEQVVLSLMCMSIVGLGAYAPMMAEDAGAAKQKAVFEKLRLLSDDKRVEAPDFSLPDIQGNTVTLSDLQGQVVFLNFWTTWCPHCRTERPALQALYDAHKDEGFVILTVSMDQGKIEIVREYMQALELTLPTVHDATNDVAREYGVRGVPMTFFLDNRGLVLGGVVGPHDWDSDDFHDLVEILLAETLPSEDSPPVE